MKVGQRIKLIAEILHVSMSELADLMGISAQNLSLYANDKREPKNIFLQHFKKIGINTDWLISGKGEMFIDNSIKNKIISSKLKTAGKYDYIINTIIERIENLENKNYSTNIDENKINDIIERIENLENKNYSTNIDENKINDIIERIENLENYITIKDKVIEYLIDNLERYKNENK